MMLNDITERKGAEEALRGRQERFWPRPLTLEPLDWPGTQAIQLGRAAGSMAELSEVYDM